MRVAASSAAAPALTLGPFLSVRRAELVKLLAAQPWGDKSGRYFMSREQEYTDGLRAAVGIW